MQGVFLGGDLRTFQSNLSEQLRFLPVRDFVSLLYHVRESQRKHRSDLIRAAETIAESRLSAQSRSVQELERLTIGTNEALYEGFLAELTDNFRHILYGREEDVIGIHIISYFIGRSIPQLRDRPTSRRTPGTGSRTRTANPGQYRRDHSSSRSKAACCAPSPTIRRRRSCLASTSSPPGCSAPWNASRKKPLPRPNASA